MVNITIDGQNLQVPEGTTVLRAAQSAGIHVPTLCDHPELTPYGGCRLCLVEVEGARTLQPSCTLPVSNNMVVRTDSERIRSARKFVLTLIFSERNHFCPYCQVSGGDCELQNAAYDEGMTHWPLQPNWQRQDVDASNKYFVLDQNRCILCRRCVRACGELVGNYTLGFEQRGAKSVLVADLGTPLGESTCVSCGTCVQVCPTGALIDRVSAYRGKELQVEHHQTVCVGCSVGCGIDVLTRDNQIVRIEGNWEAETNGGVLCKVGRFEQMDEERERLATPLIRKDGKLVAATWNEALTVVADRFQSLAGKNGDGVAALASTRLPAESLYLFKQIFAEQFKSNMVTSIEEGQTTATSSLVAAEMGKPFEGSLDAVETADCIVAVGVNLADNHEVAGFFVKRVLAEGVKLVIIDPESNPMDALATATLKARAGTDTEVLQGLTGVILQQGLAKSETSLDAAKAIGEAVVKCGISQEELAQAAQVIGESERPMFVYGKGITARNTPQALKALVELAYVTGALTNDYTGILSTKGEANSVAAAQYGLDKPFEINGHQAAFIALGDDKPSQRLVKQLGKTPFTVVQASYVSPLTAMADVVLPATMWAEEEGHFVNLSGCVQVSMPSLEAPEGIRSTASVLSDIAGRMGLDVNADGWKDGLYQRVAAVSIR